MRQRHFEIFHAVALAGSVGEAAKRLNVSQPAVSKYLTELQAELGFALRTGRAGGYALTQEGRALFEEINKSLIAFERVRQVAFDIKAMRSGHLDVACLPMFASDPLPSILRRFLDIRPRTAVTVTTVYSAEVIERVATGKADIGIGLHVTSRADITSVPIASFDLVAVMSAADPLSARRTIRPGDLTGREIVTLGTDDIVQSEIDAVLERHGVRPARRISVLASEVVLSSVVAGLGIGLVDSFSANRFLRAHPKKRIVPRAFHPPISYIVSTIARTPDSSPPLARDFARAVAKWRVESHRQDSSGN